MSKTVQWKRGNTSQNSTYVGAQGEITVNTDTWNLHVHDGLTAGGWVIDSANGGGSFSNLTVTGNIDTGNLTASGNISGVYFVGNGSQLTGLPASYADSNVVVLLADFGTNSISTTGNITAGYLFGNGSQLTGITSGYGNSNVAAYLPTYTGNLTAGNVLTDNYRYANGSSILGNLTVGGAANQILIPTVENAVGIQQVNTEGIGFIFRNTTSGIFSNLTVYSRFDNNFSFQTANSSAFALSIGNSSITINDATGQMTFSPNAAGNVGYDFSATGEINAIAYYADADYPVGYSFTTPGTDTGLSHYYTDPGNTASISVMRLRHDSVVVAEFFDNLTTQLSGNLVVSQDGDTYGTFPNAYVQVYSNVNSYSQMVLQNTNNGSLASTDIVATAGNGTDEQYFLDLGIASNNYSYPGYGLIKPNDVYLLAVGDNITGPGSVDSGNLIIGTTTGNVLTFVGAPEDANVITRVDAAGLTVTGDLLPGANITYSLGNANRQWADLWVANNTIYIGGVPLGVSGNVLTVNGEPVLSNDSNSSITTTGDISAGNVNATGNIISNGTVQGNVVTAVSAINTAGTIAATGNIEGGNISTAGAITAGGQVYAQYFDLKGGEGAGNSIGQLGYSGNIVALNGINGVNIVTTADEGGPRWTFNTSGDLGFPGSEGTNYVIGESEGGLYISSSESLVIVTDEGTTDKMFVFDTTGDLTAPGNITTSGTIASDNGSGYQTLIDPDEITAVYNGSTIYTIAKGPAGGSINTQAGKSFAITTDDNNYSWTFYDDGVLDTPGDIDIGGGIKGAGSLNIQAAPNGNAYVNLNDINDSYIGAAANLYLLADSDNREWIFDTNGDLTAPGNVTATRFLTTGNITGGNLITDGSLTFPNSGVLTSNNGQLIFGTGNFDLRTAVASAGAGYDFTIGAGSINGSATSAAVTTIHGGAAGVEGITGGNAILVGGGAITSGVGGNAIVRAGYGIAGYGNVLIENGTNTWTFANSGVLTAPGAISATGNITAGNIDTDGQITVDALSITNSRIDAVTQFTIATSNTATGNSSSILMDRNGVGVVVQLEDTSGGPYYWGLYQDNILFPDGSRQYSAYGNANVVANLAALGSNPISTTGNITADNFIGNISITGNVTGTSSNVELVAGSYTWTFDNTGVFTLPAGAGAGAGLEGGELQLTQAANSTLAGDTITIDNYGDTIRFFESGSPNKGAYIDLSQAADGAGTLLNNRVSAFADAGTFVTMDNLKSTVTSSGNRGLSLATVSGTVAGYASGSYSLVSGSPGGNAASISLTTSASTSILGYNLLSEGDQATYVIRDNTNSRVYRITLIIGPGWNSNFIGIERLL